MKQQRLITSPASVRVGEPDPARRDALRRGACACLGAGLATVGVSPARADEPASQRPAPGDRLVLAAGDEPPRPLVASDVKPGAKPLQVFPFDAAAGVVRDGSRLNKVLLVKLDPAGLDDAARSRAADGVLAFSAVCTHQGCDVSEWNEAEKALLCFCHFSRFDPARLGQVVAGPASRGLPNLPLKLDGGLLTVASPFSTSLGAKAAG
ncbi:QcrA and Rieske domain-containing protein [Azohydromonas lata]|uniref:QcrA and Rieske domain-containing protein n=1 Tax=Azohydromonas lata TaxID=45677 RepID=UPI0009FF9E32|nr:Rieske 2Fe-2S domain-containing protein [Azohydromonas lata]